MEDTPTSPFPLKKKKKYETDKMCTVLRAVSEQW